MKPYDRRSPVYTGTLTDWPTIRALWRPGRVTVRIRNAAATDDRLRGYQAPYQRGASHASR